MVDDLVELSPVPKYHLPDGIDTSSAFAGARSKIAEGRSALFPWIPTTYFKMIDDHGAAHDILSQLIQVLCSVTGSIHPDVAEAFSILSLISYDSPVGVFRVLIAL